MTVIDFTPSPIAPFQFQAVLDGENHVVIITWNVYRAGWYIAVYQENSTLVALRALVASPPDYEISMTAGYFTSRIVYNSDLRQFMILP